MFFFTCMSHNTHIMPQCACQTKNGMRCTYTAREGSRYCGVHQRCAQPSSQPASKNDMETDIAHMQQAVVRIGGQARELARERDFYHHKLEEIADMCEADAQSTLSKRILKVLYREE